jgi:methionyl-tRNA formyltransferase
MTPELPRIALFLGTQRGYTVLSALLDAGRNVASVLILAQQAHETENYTARIAALCEKAGIPHTTTREVKPSEYAAYLREMAPEVVFVISWRFLISEACFSIPPCGIFILHDSLLPKYRGHAPTNWVIINGEEETGLTLQYIHPEMDMGDIVDQIRIPLARDETARTLNDKFLAVYPQIVLENLDAIIEGRNRRTPQDNRHASYACKRSPEDGRIDFRHDTEHIVRLVRGLTAPYPGAFCHYRERRVVVWEAEVLENPRTYAGRIPGKIVRISPDQVEVLTGDGILRILSVGVAEPDFPPVPPGEVLNALSVTLH